MGSRLNSGKCLMCGQILVCGADGLPISGPYQCCSKCTDIIERKRYELKQKVENNKVKTKTIVNSRQILRQVKPSGPKVQGGVEFGPSKIRPE